MILTVCPNPTLQKTLELSKFRKGNINRTVSHRIDASGKGVNVSRVLAQLGMDVTHITQLGGRNKQWFMKLLAQAEEKEQFTLEWVHTNSEIRFCYTVLEKKSNNVYETTEIIEESERVFFQTEEKLRDIFMNLCKKETCEALIISGSKAKGFSDSLYPDMVSHAVKQNILTIADFRGSDLQNTLKKVKTIPRNSLIIKPNEQEFNETFVMQQNSDNIKPIQDKMIEIYTEYGCKTIITRGSRSVLAYDGEKNYDLETIPPAMLYNTTGCGDAFTAGLTASLIQTQDFYRSLQEGNRCASLNASRKRPGDILTEESVK